MNHRQTEQAKRVSGNNTQESLEEDMAERRKEMKAQVKG